jgi:hypothetical protein
MNTTAHPSFLSVIRISQNLIRVSQNLAAQILLAKILEAAFAVPLYAPVYPLFLFVIRVSQNLVGLVAKVLLAFPVEDQCS